jgi:mono/diheme cytochrome c family protein
MIRSGSRTLVVALIAACGSSPAPTTTPAEPAHDHDHMDTTLDPKVKADLLASERAAWDAAKPVFDTACATCHTKAGKKAAKKKLDHFDFDSYPPGGHHTGTIGYTIREVLGFAGKPATMPDNQPGSVQGDDLAKIKAWTDAWEAADKAGAHPPVGPIVDDD